MKRFENFYFIDKFSCCCTFVCQKPVFLTICLSFYYFTAIVCNIYIGDNALELQAYWALAIPREIVKCKK